MRYLRGLNKVLHLRTINDVFLRLVLKLGGLTLGVNTMKHFHGTMPTSFCVMYIISSICARSFGKGKRFVTNSRSVMPVDQTSDRMLYCKPDSLSGCSTGMSDYHRGCMMEYAPPCTSWSR